MSQKITWELAVTGVSDLTGATLQVTRQSQHYVGTLTFKVTECIAETDDTRTYTIEELDL